MFLKNTKNVCVFAVCIVLFLLLAACGSPPIDGTDKNGTIKGNDSNSVPIRGGDLNLMAYNIDTLNPILTKSSSNEQLLKLVYEGLVQFDSRMNVIPKLAEKWQIFEEGKVWVFHLKTGINWHDKVELSADDVIHTINTIKNSDSVYKENVKYIAFSEVIDKNSIKITLNQPYGDFVRMMNFPIIPKHIAISDNNAIGTGPYKIHEYKLLKLIKLRVNENWWTGRVAFIDELNINIMPDSETAFHSLEAGEIDVVTTNVVNWRKYTSNKRLDAKEFTTNAYEFMAYNFKNPILADLNIRKAIAYAINRKKIVEEVLLGHAKISDVPIMPGSIFSSDDIIYDYNIKKSKQILKDSGWEDHDKEGVLRKKSGNINEKLSFELLINTDNPVREMAAEQIIEDLKNVGIQVTIKKQSWEELFKDIQNKKFDIVLAGINLSPSADLSFAFHSKQIKEGTNFSQYNNPQMDDLLFNIFTLTNEEQRSNAYKEINKLIVDDIPYFSLYFRNSALVYNKKIKGGINPLFNNIYNDIDKWYVKEKDN